MISPVRWAVLQILILQPLVSGGFQTVSDRVPFSNTWRVLKEEAITLNSQEIAEVCVPRKKLLEGVAGNSD